MACGAVGLVSVAANVVPEVLVKLVRSCLEGDFPAALAQQKQWYPLFRGLMSLDVNPVPIKTAAALQGHCTEEFRLPLAPMTDAGKSQLAALLRDFGLLPG